MELHKKVKLLRQAHNLSQAQMADKMGMTEQSYGRWEREETRMTIEQLQKFAQKLNINIADIIDLPEGTIISPIHDNKENTVQHGFATLMVNNYYGENAIQAENEKLKLLLETRDKELGEKERLINSQNEQIALMQELLNQFKKENK